MVIQYQTFSLCREVMWHNNIIVLQLVIKDSKSVLLAFVDLMMKNAANILVKNVNTQILENLGW